jgi:HK97 family phage major capsid protein
VSAQDIAFGQVVLKAYKYSSKTVLVPFELLQDSAIDIEAYIAQKLGERIGRITNQHFTTGTGTNQPQGVVPFSTLGKTGANGQTTSVTYDDIVDLEHALEPAYRRRARFMMHDQTLRAIKKLKDSQGRPLWLPGLAVREPDTILGYPYVINQDMPQMAASAKSILFGDFSNYFIRRVMDLTLFRITDKYVETGQVGFLAFMRTDGRGVNAGVSPVVHYANSAT